jgi:hypothetical protein
MRLFVGSFARSGTVTISRRTLEQGDELQPGKALSIGAFEKGWGELVRQFPNGKNSLYELDLRNGRRFSRS